MRVAFALAFALALSLVGTAQAAPHKESEAFDRSQSGEFNLNALALQAFVQRYENGSWVIPHYYPRSEAEFNRLIESPRSFFGHCRPLGGLASDFPVFNWERGIQPAEWTTRRGKSRTIDNFVWGQNGSMPKAPPREEMESWSTVKTYLTCRIAAAYFVEAASKQVLARLKKGKQSSLDGVRSIIEASLRAQEDPKIWYDLMVKAESTFQKGSCNAFIQHDWGYTGQSPQAQCGAYEVGPQGIKLNGIATLSEQSIGGVRVSYNLKTGKTVSRAWNQL